MAGPEILQLAVAAHQAGELKASLEHYQQFLNSHPRHLDALNFAAAAAFHINDIEMAAGFLERLIDVAPDHAPAHNNLGTALRKLERSEEAVAAYRRALDIDPEYVDAYFNLGSLLRQLGEPDEAEGAFRRGLDLRPGDAEALFGLGSVLLEKKNLVEAEAVLRKGLAIQPDDAGAWFALGSAHQQAEKADDAIACYRRCLELDPNLAEALHNLGFMLYFAGHPDEAIASFKRALAVRPDYGRAFYGLTRISTYKPSDEEVRAMEELHRNGTLAGDDAVHLRYALARTFEIEGEYDRAFEVLEQWNQEMAKRGDFDSSRHRKAMLEIKEMFPERRGAADRNASDADHVPVFVVGLSRSGKTLVESLLVQHEGAHGAGEIGEWLYAAEAVLKKYSIPPSFPEWMGFLSDDQIRETGELFMENIIKSSPNSKLLINTSPGNHPFIGLMLQALPMARIIYCHRDPMDHCLFVYFYTYQTGHEYSYDLDHLASYYADHCDIMDHWQRLYGDRILSVRYEDLVRNPDDVGARIFAFCGLDYDPAAISHAFTSDEIGHWKHYESHLGALRQALGDLAK